MNKQPPSAPLPSAGRRPRKDDGSGRERLLDAAILLFADRGIANTTVAQIAKAGTVTSAMVHYWFDTRESLYDAVVEERLLPLLQVIWEPADLGRENALELIQGLLTRMFDVIDKAPWLPALWLREIIQVGGLLRERVFRHIPPQRTQAFRQKVIDAQALGEINPRIDPHLLFISMLAQVMLPQATARIWHEVNPTLSLTRDQVRKHTLALLMNGLTGPNLYATAYARKPS